MHPSSNYLSKFFVFLLPFLFVGSAEGFMCTDRINVALAANGATASASSDAYSRITEIEAWDHIKSRIA